MIEDPYTISVIFLYSSIGAVIRALFGIRKSYGKVTIFNLDVKRLVVEFCTSMLIGTFGVIILNGLGVNYEIRIFALLGGLLGADILNLITKKVGLTKGLDVMHMSDEEVQLANFNERQINAISYLRRNKKITKKEYQKLNQTTHDCTKKDLNQLLRKKKLKKYGSGKSTYYKLS